MYQGGCISGLNLFHNGGMPYHRAKLGFAVVVGSHIESHQLEMVFLSYNW